jgi:inosine-uridine nucleoside N-ribohydrolase
LTHGYITPKSNNFVKQYHIIEVSSILTVEEVPMRLVIDTDAGVDDAVAILMALHAFPGDQVAGITTVFGNVDLHQANHNVQQYVARLIHSSNRHLNGALFSAFSRPQNAPTSPSTAGLPRRWSPV